MTEGVQKFQKKNFNANQNQKRKFQKKGGTKNKNDDAPSQGSIKKRIRDTQRLLSRPNLDADVRRDQERKLQALQVALTDHETSEKARKLVKKYRMVRFFERKKAERKLSSAKTALAENPESAEALAKLQEAHLDVAYTKNYPTDRKYISLYPKDPITSEKVLQERDKIRESIKAKMELDAEINGNDNETNGTDEDDYDGSEFEGYEEGDFDSEDFDADVASETESEEEIEKPVKKSKSKK